MTKTLRKILLGGAMALACGLAPASGHAQSAADLGKSLTPFGGVKAGQQVGSWSIPAWDGGIATPPAGYKAGDHHQDPFAGEAPVATITAANAGEFASVLTEGAKRMLQKYPDYKMVLYPSHRSFAAPQAIYDATMANASSARLNESGDGVEGASRGIPFPVLTGNDNQKGLQAIWNHLLRYRGTALLRRVGQVNPTANGDYTLIVIAEKLLLPYSAGEPGNALAYFLQEVVSPASRAGLILLVHDTINQVAEPRNAWTYNPGQRRVRLAPNIAYDAPGTAADGQRTTDNFDMFNGSPDRYNWTYVGLQPMIVPYNDYKLHAKGIPYDQIVKPGHINQDLARYELHRVHVVDATLKSGTSHIYAKRRFYIDEDSWQILAVDHYDGLGEYWRYGESFGIEYYDVPAYWSTLDCIYDLQSGRYTCIGLDNNEPMYDFKAQLSPADFRPDTLRRLGTR